MHAGTLRTEYDKYDCWSQHLCHWMKKAHHKHLWSHVKCYRNHRPWQVQHWCRHPSLLVQQNPIHSQENLCRCTRNARRHLESIVCVHKVSIYDVSLQSCIRCLWEWPNVCLVSITSTENLNQWYIGLLVGVKCGLTTLLCNMIVSSSIDSQYCWIWC